MMTNLFSIFDPSTSIFFNLSLNWMSMILIFFFSPMYFWLIPNRYMIYWMFIVKKLHLEFKTLIGYKNTNGTTLIFISIFSWILYNNFLGIFPYIFTSTSHLTFCLSITIPLWLTFMFFGWYNHSQHMFSHMIPKSTPKTLMPFMVLIETISNIIRPGTLSIRLTANMIAGHLLLTLLSSMSKFMPSKFILLLIFIQFLLLTLEFTVTIIQSYVISILSIIYSSETN